MISTFMTTFEWHLRHIIIIFPYSVNIFTRSENYQYFVDIKGKQDILHSPSHTSHDANTFFAYSHFLKAEAWTKQSLTRQSGPYIKT